MIKILRYVQDPDKYRSSEALDRRPRVEKLPGPGTCVEPWEPWEPWEHWDGGALRSRACLLVCLLVGFAFSSRDPADAALHAAGRVPGIVVTPACIRIFILVVIVIVVIITQAIVDTFTLFPLLMALRLP